ncbi:MAG TPA: DMT family transporter [Candidatus Saccharimonadales bacterium]|nr:DMT family transporter [Candidatus Saccharimonadales bacterium]
MGYLFVLGYILIVGVATFIMKVSLKSLSPYQLNFLMGIGMLATGIPALLIAHRSFKMPPKELPAGIAIGVMMAVGSILYVLALNKLTASVASVLAATYVAVVIILSWLFLRENFDTVKILGITLTFIGALLLTLKS